MHCKPQAKAIAYTRKHNHLLVLTHVLLDCWPSKFFGVRIHTSQIVQNSMVALPSLIDLHQSVDFYSSLYRERLTSRGERLTSRGERLTRRGNDLKVEGTTYSIDL